MQKQALVVADGVPAATERVDPRGDGASEAGSDIGGVLGCEVSQGIGERFHVGDDD